MSKVFLSMLFFILSAFFMVHHAGKDPVWFEFKPDEDHSGSEIAMDGWLDAPAGRHGYLRMEADQLVFKDGTAVKFWGVNISSGRAFVDREKADQWATHLAKYGVNAVRFHKFTKDGYQKGYSTVLDEEKYKNFDYFNHALREKGIYYGWSHIYGQRVKPADKEQLLAYDEVASLKYPWQHLNGTTASLVNFAEDLQNLSIELTVGMLQHVNPHTGLRYADDPALIFIEMQNEDNIFWSAIGKALEQAPTYRALLCRQFSTWLKSKYGSDEKLAMAWKRENIPVGQSIENQNVFPAPNHSQFTNEYDEAYRKGRPMAQHVLDKMQFLHEQQLAFYERFEKAIRATGYKGVLVGSCWQAGMGPSHYYNLHADYQTGMIDRHNYWGGGTGHHLKPGKVKNKSMLARPGSGILSTGMQQVADRPFSLSEWMCLLPNEWTAEGVPLVGLYGMGLQGWDASFHFGSDFPHYTPTLHTPGVYNVESPLQLALYPAVARMVYRNDIKEGKTIAERRVHLPSLRKGKLGFYEKIEQGYDDKFISGDVPAELLAAGKVAVAFSDRYEDLVVNEVTEMWDKKAKWIRSSTGQLYWDYSEKGYVTANTPYSKTLIGFAKDKRIDLGQVSLKTNNEFAIISVSSLEKDGDLKTAERILITTMARAINTGMTYNDNRNEVIRVGTAPILLEPVEVAITFAEKIKGKVHILDHVGKKTGQLLEPAGNTLSIKGSDTQAIYYLMEIER